MKYKYRILKKDGMYVAQIKKFLFWKTLYEDMNFGSRVSEFVDSKDAKDAIQRYFYKMKERKKEGRKNIIVDSGELDV